MLLKNSTYLTQNTEGVFLGRAEDENGKTGEPIWFTGEGALVTIAPPGAGKGQAQIIPNLLTYNGPAIVLDIKRENYDLTHEWRRENVGPVFKFAPFDADSHNYNPLDFMEHHDPAAIWDDARLTASMLTVQSGKDDFWEGRARDLLSAILAFVKMNRKASEQNMQTVLDLLHPTADEFKMLIDVMQSSKIRAMVRTGNSLSTCPDKQREGIFARQLTCIKNLRYNI